MPENRKCHKVKITYHFYRLNVVYSCITNHFVISLVEIQFNSGEIQDERTYKGRGTGHAVAMED